jgi:ribonuclease HII
VIGIDEVGRGCWAGPLLVVAARQREELPTGLKDSKVVSKKKRELLAPLIQQSCDIGEGWVTAQEIDRLGLTEAMRLGVVRSLIAIRATTDEVIIIDGNTNYCPATYRQATAVINADELYQLVSAASIYAKVTRDRYMSNLSGIYIPYQFDKHVGYGTKLHMEMIQEHGLTDMHRMSFAPIKKFATL